MNSRHITRNSTRRSGNEGQNDRAGGLLRRRARADYEEDNDSDFERALLEDET